MNKTIALLILGVILLAMALIMVNQYMTQTDGTAITPGGSAPVTVAPTGPTASAPQATTPEGVLSQLEQRAATSELAPREPSVSPPIPQTMPQAAPQTVPQKTPQTMPAWASNGGSPASGSALTPPGAGASASGARPSEPAPQTSAAVQAKAEPTKTESGKTEAAKTEHARADSKAEQPKAKAEPAKVQVKPKGPKTIKKLTVFRMDDEVAVRVEGSEALTYKTMQLKSPDRLVVDLEGEWVIKAPGVPDNKYVSNVRIGKQSDKTRIVIDLKQNPQTVRFVKRGVEGVDVRIK